MAITQKAFLYYADDPDKKVFRVVMLSGTDDDSYFSDPEKMNYWLTLAIPDWNPPRAVTYEVVPLAQPLSQPFLYGADCPATTGGIDANGNPWPPTSGD